MKIFLLPVVLVLMISCKPHTVKDNTLALSAGMQHLALSSQNVARQWAAYQDFEYNLKLICNTNSLNAISFRKSLRSDVSAMANNIPQAFNTSSVKNRIQVIENQVSSFYNEVHEDELNKHVVKQHVEQIMNAFDQLNETLNSTLVQR